MRVELIGGPYDGELVSGFPPHERKLWVRYRGTRHRYVPRVGKPDNEFYWESEEVVSE